MPRLDRGRIRALLCVGVLSLLVAGCPSGRTNSPANRPVSPANSTGGVANETAPNGRPGTTGLTITLPLPGKGWAIVPAEGQPAVLQLLVSPDPAILADIDRRHEAKGLPRASATLSFYAYPDAMELLPLEAAQQFVQDSMNLVNAVRYLNTNRDDYELTQVSPNTWYQQAIVNVLEEGRARRSMVWYYYRPVKAGPRGAPGIYELAVRCRVEEERMLGDTVPKLAAAFKK